MTPQEFKAWFEGFTEAFAGVPTKTQWARVKDRVGEIDGKPITERVFVDRYWPTYYPPHRLYWGVTSLCGGSGPVNTYTAGATGQVSNGVSNAVINFNSSQAMLALGRADAQALTN